MTMNAKQAQIHLTRAVVSPPDFGDVLTTEFKVLIVHSARVSKSPSLAGIASFGTTKLTYRTNWHPLLECLELINRTKDKNMIWSQICHFYLF